MKRFLAIVAVLAIVLPVAAGSLKLVRIHHENAPALAAELACAGFDVLANATTPDWLDVIVSDEELSLLEQRGLTATLLEVSRPFREIQAEQLVLMDDPPPGYPDLDEILAQMNAAAAAYPNVCQVVDLTTRYGGPATYEGRHLYAVKISDNVAQDEDEIPVLFVSNHHARELITPLIGLHAIEQLTTGYGSDPQITALVNQYEIWIAPVWNPDGYVYVFDVQNFWRKNRSMMPGGVGVDLNRNYPFGWDSPCGGSTSVTSETYRGPSAASEAETQTMILFGNDRHFAKVADFHSYSREVRYGFGCWDHPFDTFNRDEAAALAATMSGYRPATSCCTGGDIHWHIGNHGTHAFLWETGTSFQPSYANGLAEAQLVFNSILALLERPVSISGHVVDAVTGEPVVAQVTYVGVVFENGEENYSEGRFGRYHGTLPPGTYTLEFSAPAYVTQRQTINVSLTSAQVLDIQLMPENPYQPGDLNCDGFIDNEDIDPFVLALTDPAGYPLVWPNCDLMLADVNGDGFVDNEDIDPFVALITGP